MGCNCKAERKLAPNGEEIKIKIKLSENIIHYSLKVIGFLLFIGLLPFINLVIIWVVFKMLVLNKELDIKTALVAVLSKFKSKEGDDDDDDDDDEYYELTENDVELVDVEDITAEVKHK